MNIPHDSIMVIIQFLPYSVQVQVCPELKASIEVMQVKIIARSMKANRLRIMRLMEREAASIAVTRAAHCLYHEPCYSWTLKTIRHKYPEIAIDETGGAKKAQRSVIYRLTHGQLVDLGW